MERLFVHEAFVKSTMITQKESSVGSVYENKIKIMLATTSSIYFEPIKESAFRTWHI